MSQGLRILDTENHIVSVGLNEILQEIDGDKYYWSILFFDGIGSLKKWGSFTRINNFHDFKNTSNKHPQGLIISWDDLQKLYWEVFSKDKKFMDKLSKKFKKIKTLKPDFFKNLQ